MNADAVIALGTIAVMLALIHGPAIVSYCRDLLGPQKPFRIRWMRATSRASANPSAPSGEVDLSGQRLRYEPTGTWERTAQEGLADSVFAESSVRRFAPRPFKSKASKGFTGGVSHIDAERRRQLDALIDIRGRRN